MATPGVRCGIGSGRGRCLSLADYVKEPAATREAMAAAAG